MVALDTSWVCNRYSPSIRSCCRGYEWKEESIPDEEKVGIVPR